MLTYVYMQGGKMTNKKEPDAIKTIASINTNKKQRSKVLAFRFDSEILSKVEALEKLKKKSKAELIRKSIESSFNTQLIEEGVKRLIPIIKSVFKDARIKRKGLGMPIEEPESNSFNLSFDKTHILFELPEFKDKLQHKQIEEDYTPLLFLEITALGLKTIKIEITKPLFEANVSKIESNLLKDLQMLALKNNLELKSLKLYKEGDSMGFDFEKEGIFQVDNENNIQNFKEIMERFHKAVKDFKELKYFKNRSNKS